MDEGWELKPGTETGTLVQIDIIIIFF